MGFQTQWFYSANGMEVNKSTKYTAHISELKDISQREME